MYKAENRTISRGIIAVNFVIVVDRNKKRLQSYFEKISPLLPPVEGLVTSSCMNEDFGAVWAYGAWTPVDYVCESNKAAIVFGDAIKGPGSERLSAEQLRRLWNNSSVPCALDGYHAAVTYDSVKGLTVGADLLGLFPIYYYVAENVILVASSPELFFYHPCFKMKLNIAGFVALVLTNGTFDGETLLCGVKRLSPGYLLKSRFGEPVEEILQYKLPVSEKYFGMDFSDQVDILDQAIDEAILRHVPKGEKYCLTLSGGLDSRLLGGYLKKNEVDVVAATEGLPTDYDMKCANLVANQLGFKHSQFTIEAFNYPHFASLEAKWQHLNAGFGTIMWWGNHQYIRNLAPRVVAGLFGTELLGDLFTGIPLPKPGKTISLETLQEYDLWASSPEGLKSHLKPEYGALVPETLRRIKEIFDAYPGVGFQRLWCWGAHKRARVYVGNIAWKLSFGAWPVLPYVDHKVIETAAGMSLEALAYRKAEKDVLCRKFPNLARLPIDRGLTHDTTPLLPTPMQRGMQQIIADSGIWKSSQARSIRNKLIIGLKGDGRYYSRHLSLNYKGWKAVQKLATPNLKLTSQFLNNSAVQELVSLCNHEKVKGGRSRAQIKMTGAIDKKFLLGFAIWRGQHHECTGD